MIHRKCRLGPHFPSVQSGNAAIKWPLPAANGMRGRFSLIAEIGELQGLFGFDGDGLTQPVMAVLHGEGRQAAYLRWGRIPSWTKSASVGNHRIDARVETVAEHPSFRTALTRRRCLVLAAGSYEWRRVGNRRIPMRIVMKSEKPFAIASLWDTWRGPKGGIVKSCTIITLQWRAFGEHSIRNWSITVTIEAERKQFEKLQNTSEFSITGRADRLGLDSWCLPSVHKDSIQDRSQHQRFGAYCCYLTSQVFQKCLRRNYGLKSSG